jgi:hypothetical protein
MENYLFNWRIKMIRKATSGGMTKEEFLALPDTHIFKENIKIITLLLFLYLKNRRTDTVSFPVIKMDEIFEKYNVTVFKEGGNLALQLSIK